MKTAIFRIPAVFLVSVCLVFASVCSNAESNKQSTFDAPAFYAPVLEQYRTAINERWDFETLDSKGLCYLPALIDNAADSIGYCFLPLEPNHPACLLISFIPDKRDAEPKYELLSAYAPGPDNKPELLFNGAERDSFILCGNVIDGYTLAETGSNGAAETVFVFWKVSESKLTPIETVVFSGSANEKEPWFHAAGRSETAPEKMQHISEKDASSIINSYKPCTESLDFTPFSYFASPQ